MLSVIGSGFGRTGTLSLKHALDQLGVGPCYHMQEVLKRPSHIRAWHDVGNDRPVDWHRLFADFSSTVDFPASVVYRDLLTAFPEAKVIHTVRDPERWYASTHETIYRARTMFPRWLVASVPIIRTWLEMSDALVWQGLFDGRFEDRDHAIAVYERHTAEVRAAVPADRLLVFEATQGWEPLCAFLDLPVPATTFPKVNDRAQMQRRLTAARLGSRAVPIVAGAGLGALAVAKRRRTSRRTEETGNRCAARVVGLAWTRSARPTPLPDSPRSRWPCCWSPPPVVPRTTASAPTRHPRVGRSATTS